MHKISGSLVAGCLLFGVACGEGADGYDTSRCGDGFLQLGEECDPGDPRRPPCEADCTFTPMCGNGIIEEDAGEECDDGNARDNDDCLNNCKLATCGDGIVNNGYELCDEGEDNSWEFPARCTPECGRNHSCWNGVWEPEKAEECDDEAKAYTSSCIPGCKLNVCGDGSAYLDDTPGTNNTNPLHECDDANEDDSDACTSDCAWNVCGDGFVFSKGYGEQYGHFEDGDELADNPNPIEECDDGNDEPGDGCHECAVEGAP